MQVLLLLLFCPVLTPVCNFHVARAAVGRVIIEAALGVGVWGGGDGWQRGGGGQCPEGEGHGLLTGDGGGFIQSIEGDAGDELRGMGAFMQLSQGCL